MDTQALSLSFVLATATSACLLLLGLPLAWWLATTRARWRFLVEAAVALPLVLPPTVLGFYVLASLGPRSPLGRAFEAVTGEFLPFSFSGLLLASILYSLPFAVQPMASAMQQVDRNLIEAAYTLGLSRSQAFRRVILPLSLPGILTGLVLCFAHTLGEFGVVLMVGGNLPGRTRTVSIAIYDHVQALEYAQAAQTSALLLGLSFVCLALTFGLQRGALSAWPRPLH